MDLDQLKGPVSADAPCGESLEYDPAFGELERAATDKPEQQFGETVIEEVGPDWKAVWKAALSLSEKTRDLRIGVYLCQAGLATGGLGRFADSLELLLDWVSGQWALIHPQLDADDDNDPTIRVNTLSMICAPERVIKRLEQLPLVALRGVGDVRLRDLLVQAGEREPLADNDKRPDAAGLAAVFGQCELEELAKAADDARRACAALDGLDNFLSETLGADRSPEFAPLAKTLVRIRDELALQHEKRAPQPVVAAAGCGAAAGASAAERPKLSIDDLELNSRDDVIRVLNRVCDYFARHEPSSPIPLILRRAARLIPLSFLEIIRDVAPGAFNEAALLEGNTQNSA